MSLQEDIAQQIWQEFAVATGRALPAGLADRLAQVAVECMTPETRTLTDGWVQPMFEWSRQQAIRAHEMAGLPVPHIPPPEIREQQRFVTEWEDIS